MAFRGTEILLIEEALDRQLRMRIILEGSGATIHDARTAKSGVMLASQIFPHVIVVDLDMGGAAGFVAISMLKQIPGISKIPVLALAHANDKVGILRAKSLGAVEILLKPFAVNVLVQKVERLLLEKPFGHQLIPASDTPRATLTMPVEILSVGEGGFTIDAPVILGSEADVKLDAPLLQRLGCSAAITRTTAKKVRASESGSFIHEINLIGIGPKIARSIRMFLRNRQLETPPS